MGQTTHVMPAVESRVKRESVLRRLVNGFSVPVTVIVSLCLLKIATPINYDPDLYWHLETGEYIVTHGMLPYSDFFSHTMSGHDWVLHEWLSEVIFYGIVTAAGFKGLDLFVAVLYTATFYLLFRLCRKVSGTETKALVVALLFFAPLIGFTSPRPQLFTYLFFVLYAGVLFDYKYQTSTRLAAALPAVMLVWANMHGASLVGIALLALFIGAEWCTVLMRQHTEPAQKTALKRLTLWALLAAGMTLFNPRFIEYWTYPFYVLNLDVAKGLINEWQSPNFHSLHYRYFLALFLLFFTVLIYSRKKPDLAEIAVPMFFITAGFTAIRHLPFACLAAAPFFALFLRHTPLPQWRSARSKGAGLRADMDQNLVCYLNILLLACVTGSVAYKQSLMSPEALIDVALPVKAASFIETHGIRGRMFNEYGEGGYLIYRLYPERQVFIDGRADLYGNEFMKEYFEIVNGSAEWKKKFETRSIDYAVLPKHVPLRQLLLNGGTFKLVYDDERHSVLVARTAAFARLPEVPERSSEATASQR